MKKFFKFYDILLTGLGHFTCILAFLLMFVVSYEVVLRYFFNNPTDWAYSVSTFLVLSITLMAAAWVLREGAHVAIDLVTSTLSPASKALTGFITSCVGAIVCAIFTWQGIAATIESYRQQYTIISGIYVPEYTVLWIIPFGMLLLTIQFARIAGNELRDFRSSSSK